MKEITSLASFNGQNLTIVDLHGERWIPGEDIGRALEYSEPRIAVDKIFQRNDELFSEYSAVTKLVTAGGTQETRVYNEEGVIAICLKSNQPKAIAFQRWAVRTLKAAMKGQLSQANSELVELQRKHILALEQIQGLKQSGVRAYLYAPAEQQTIRDLLARGWGAYRIAAQTKRSMSGIQHFMRRNGLRRHVAQQTELAFGVAS